MKPYCLLLLILLGFERIHLLLRYLYENHTLFLIKLSMIFLGHIILSHAFLELHQRYTLCLSISLYRRRLVHSQT